MKNTALKTAGSLFLVVSLVHLSRVILRFSIAIGGHEVPVFWNAIAFVVAGALAVWMFRAAR